MAAIYDTKTVKEIFKTAGFILTDEYVSYNKKMKCICENGHEQEKPYWDYDNIEEILEDAIYG